MATLPMSVVEVRLSLWIVPPDAAEPPDAVRGALLERIDRFLGRLKRLQRVVVVVNDRYAIPAGDGYDVLRIFRDGLPSVHHMLDVKQAS